jgi:hypothetical protein
MSGSALAAAFFFFIAIPSGNLWIMFSFPSRRGCG